MAVTTRGVFSFFYPSLVSGGAKPQEGKESKKIVPGKKEMTMMTMMMCIAASQLPGGRSGRGEHRTEKEGTRGGGAAD